MPLVFENFAHHYRDSGWGDEAQRQHLGAVSDILECIVRIFRHGDESSAKILGITFDQHANSEANQVESTKGLQQQFNAKTANRAAESDQG